MIATSVRRQSHEVAEAIGVSVGPRRAGLVLVALILVAAVANLNLAVANANVALPSIGAAFEASQTALDLVAVGYSLGLAASVLYLGALGDRYGRKLMLLLGVLVSVPASLMAAFAGTVGILVVARVLGGLSAGMAFPTTLALITAPLVRAGAHKINRPVVGHRRRHRVGRPANVRLAS
jgi:MFS family permease